MQNENSNRKPLPPPARLMVPKQNEYHKPIPTAPLPTRRRPDKSGPPRNSVAKSIIKKRAELDALIARDAQWRKDHAHPVQDEVLPPPEQNGDPDVFDKLPADSFIHPKRKTPKTKLTSKKRPTGYMISTVRRFLEAQGYRGMAGHKDIAAAILAYRKIDQVVVEKRAVRKLIVRFFLAINPTATAPQQAPATKKAEPQPKFTDNYIQHLQSPEWRAFRIRIFAERGRKCEKCGAATAKELHLHHLTYANLGCEKPEDVQVLCVPCHERVHNKKIRHAA